MSAADGSSFDHDWIVVGSGFGGSVSALRLAEKGYRVGVLECGRRFDEDDYPSSAWDLRNYFWAPRLGLRGILRMSVFKDLTIATGAGVGGGSLAYANTLYVPPRAFFSDPQWADLADWEAELAPHYAEAERMLGVATYDEDDPADQILKRLGEHLGVADTYRKARVGVFLGEAGRTVPDPYFDGEGPERTGCTRCGRCMLGCPVGAKNTLRKNYLWFAERLGVTVRAEREVVDIRPLGRGDGSDGYEVVTEHPGAWVRKRRRSFTARGVVLAAGALGTNKLLQRCRLEGGLPGVSARIGEVVRTNSEAVPAVLVPKGYPDDLMRRVSITSSIYPDPDTHIETLTYGREGDYMTTGMTLLTGAGTKRTRPLKWLAQVLRHPRRFAQTLWPVGQSERQIIILVMQTLPSAMRFRPTRTALLRRPRLQTEQDPANPIPTYLPIANQAAAWIAEQTGGIAESQTLEALANKTMTAHLLGGAIIGRDAGDGVVDAQHRVFGYENLMICDGSVVPANVGANPSLTITAMAERAMAGVPDAAARPDTAIGAARA